MLSGNIFKQVVFFRSYKISSFILLPNRLLVSSQRDYDRLVIISLYFVVFDNLSFSYSAYVH